jgi:hypothetical protein
MKTDFDAGRLGVGRFVNLTAEISEQTRSEALPPRTAYNIVGQVLIGLGAYDFGTYARRVADLDGVRRAALSAQAPLRSKHSSVRPKRWMRISCTP